MEHKDTELIESQHGGRSSNKEEVIGKVGSSNMQGILYRLYK